MNLKNKLALRYAAVLKEEKVRKSKGFPPGTRGEEITTFLRGLGFTAEPKPGYFQTISQTAYGALPDVTRVYEDMRLDTVTSLPSTPIVGKRYVMNLTPPKDIGGGNYEIDFKKFIGVDGILFVSPTGGTYHLLAEEPGGAVRSNSAFNKKLNTDPTFREFLSGGDTSKNTLQGPTPPAPGGRRTKVRTLENTGTCPCCFVNVKLTPGGDTVLHGYTRPGGGSVSGKCFGVGYPSFEVSPEGTRDYIQSLQWEIQAKERDKQALADAPVLPHPTFYNKKVTKDDPLFVHAVKIESQRIDADIRSIQGQIAYLEEKIRSRGR